MNVHVLVDECASDCGLSTDAGKQLLPELARAEPTAIPRVGKETCTVGGEGLESQHSEREKKHGYEWLTNTYTHLTLVRAHRKKGFGAG